jgi:putative hydrolase of the HAD superfamily
LEENGLIAENTLFIDDSIQHIEGAKKAGIKTFHLEKNKSILDLVPDIIQSEHHQ